MSSGRTHHPYGWHDAAPAAPLEAPWAIDQAGGVDEWPQILGHAPSEVRAKLLCLALREHARESQRRSPSNPGVAERRERFSYRCHDRGLTAPVAVRWAVYPELGAVVETPQAVAYTHSEDVAAEFAAALTTAARLSREAIPTAARTYVSARMASPM